MTRGLLLLASVCLALSGIGVAAHDLWHGLPGFVCLLHLVLLTGAAAFVAPCE